MKTAKLAIKKKKVLGNEDIVEFGVFALSVRLWLYWDNNNDSES